MSDDTFNYNYLFPSLVVYKDFGKVPDDLIDLSRDIISEHGGKPFNSPCLSTVRTYANVLNLKEFTKIKEQIIQTSEEKDFVFQSPYHFYQPITPKYTETNLNNCHTSDYNSLEGRCIIFMSNLMHRTLPATDERISLSFNIKYKNV